MGRSFGKRQMVLALVLAGTISLLLTISLLPKSFCQGQSTCTGTASGAQCWTVFYLAPTPGATSISRQRTQMRPHRSGECECPNARRACSRWRRLTGDGAAVREFYGHSYMAPTPTEYVVQHLGPTVTKGFIPHLRNTTRKMGHHPNPPRGRRRARASATPTTPTAPGFDNAPPCLAHR